MVVTVENAERKKHLSYTAQNGGQSLSPCHHPDPPVTARSARCSRVQLKLPYKVLHHWQRQQRRLLTAWLVNVLAECSSCDVAACCLPLLLLLLPTLSLCMWLMRTPETSQDAHRCSPWTDPDPDPKLANSGSPASPLTPPCQAVCNCNANSQRQWHWERYWTDRYMAINQTTLSLDFQPRRRCEKFYDSFAFAVQFLQNLHPRGVLGCLIVWTLCTAVDRIASRCVSHILEATAEVPSSAQLWETVMLRSQNVHAKILFDIFYFSSFGILGNKYL